MENIIDLEQKFDKNLKELKDFIETIDGNDVKTHNRDYGFNYLNLLIKREVLHPPQHGEFYTLWINTKKIGSSNNYSIITEMYEILKNKYNTIINNKNLYESNSVLEQFIVDMNK